MSDIIPKPGEVYVLTGDVGNTSFTSKIFIGSVSTHKNFLGISVKYVFYSDHESGMFETGMTLKRFQKKVIRRHK